MFPKKIIKKMGEHHWEIRHFKGNYCFWLLLKPEKDALLGEVIHISEKSLEKLIKKIIKKIEEL